MQGSPGQFRKLRRIPWGTPPGGPALSCSGGPARKVGGEGGGTVRSTLAPGDIFPAPSSQSPPQLRPTQPITDFSRDSRSQWPPPCTPPVPARRLHQSGLGPPWHRPRSPPHPAAPPPTRSSRVGLDGRALGDRGGSPGPGPPRGWAWSRPHRAGTPFPPRRPPALSPPFPPAHGARLGAAARAGPR